MHDGFLAGLSTSISTGARNKLSEGAIVQDVVAIHVSIRHADAPSVSTQIGTLRHLLLHHDETTRLGRWFRKVAHVRSMFLTLFIVLRATEHAIG